MPCGSVVLKEKRVTILRNDSTAEVTFENIRHVWWQCGGTILVLSRGHRGDGRTYIYWPAATIDHVRVQEIP